MGGQPRRRDDVWAADPILLEQSWLSQWDKGAPFYWTKKKKKKKRLVIIELEKKKKWRAPFLYLDKTFYF